MTRKVCFEFCRTIPEMMFFGLAHGRDCYCEPYYEMMAGDSSQCDAVCDGEPTAMCGGMKKSSIFAMHLCADTAQNLNSAMDKAGTLMTHMSGVLADAHRYTAGLDDSATTIQQSMGAAGDPEASNLMQWAKGAAGDLEKKAAALDKVVEELKADLAAAQGLTGGNMDDPETAANAEKVTSKIEVETANGEAAAEEVEGALSGLTAGEEIDAASATASLGQYKTMPYFVDKEFEDAPSTCGGTPISSPVVGLSKGGCAAACDGKVGECVGFSYFGNAEPSVCILLSKFTSTTYYTGCGDSFVQKAPSFLQLLSRKSSCSVKCYVKFSRFEGVSLAPDPSGKCTMCLKTATKAERCFE